MTMRITGTQPQMQTIANRLDKLHRVPNADTRTTTWAQPELLADGVTWSLAVPVRGMLRRLWDRIRDEGIDAVIAGTNVTKAQAQAIIDAVNAATDQQTWAEAHAPKLLAEGG